MRQYILQKADACASAFFFAIPRDFSPPHFFGNEHFHECFCLWKMEMSTFKCVSAFGKMEIATFTSVFGFGKKEIAKNKSATTFFQWQCPETKVRRPFFQKQ